MQDLLIKQVGTAATAFIAGGLANAAGFNILDATTEYDTILFNADEKVPYSPMRYAGLTLCMSTMLGGVLYAYSNMKQDAQCLQPEDSITGFMYGATAGICFSLGAKALSYTKKIMNEKQSVARVFRRHEV